MVSPEARSATLAAGALLLAQTRVARVVRLVALVGAAARAARGVDIAVETILRVAVGVFDGVHLGHQALLRDTVADARARGSQAVAVTFDRDPDQVVSPEMAAPQLLTLADKLSAIARTGVDAVLVLPFTEELSRMPARTFAEEVLNQRKKVGLQWRMRMRAHVRQKVPLEHVGLVVGVKWIDPRVARHVHIKIVVHMERLTEKRHGADCDRHDQDRKIPVKLIAFQ